MCPSVTIVNDSFFTAIHKLKHEWVVRIKSSDPCYGSVFDIFEKSCSICPICNLINLTRLNNDSICTYWISVLTPAPGLIGWFAMQPSTHFYSLLHRVFCEIRSRIENLLKFFQRTARDVSNNKALTEHAAGLSAELFSLLEFPRWDRHSSTARSFLPRLISSCLLKAWEAISEWTVSDFIKFEVISNANKKCTKAPSWNNINVCRTLYWTLNTIGWNG